MINNGKVEIADMVLIPQGVYVFGGSEKFLVLNNEPYYAVVLGFDSHSISDLNIKARVVIDYKGEKCLVAEEDVFKC
jgi:hypothetical protein